MEYKEILRIEQKITEYEDLLDSKEGTDSERLYWSEVLGKLREKLETEKIEIKHSGKYPEIQWKNHCQICGREIKDKLGVIAHHGYIRPEQGWQTDSCMGARNLPYEKSREVIPQAISYLQLQMKNIMAGLRRIEEEKLSIPYFKGSIPSTHYDYNRIKNEYFSLQEYKIKQIEREIERLQKRYDEWKLIGVAQ